MAYRLSAGVTALLTKRLLVQPGEVPVPREEVTSVVDAQGLVDVSRDEVIEASLGTGSNRRRRQGRLGLDTLDGIDIGLLLLLGEGVPAGVHGKRHAR